MFIVATVASLISTALTASVLDAHDYLAQVSANDTRLIVGALFLLVAAISVLVIPALLFPILRRQNEGLSLGYFGIRILEAVTLIVDAISVLVLVTLSRDYVAAGSPAASPLRTSGDLLQGIHHWAFPLNPIVFCGGALIFYTLLYQSKLVPRWLSVWGLLGAVLVLAFGLMRMFDAGSVLLALPIGVQEMALAAWLIVKGFDASAVASLTVHGDVPARRIRPVRRAAFE
jgi:hypothetical protein